MPARLRPRTATATGPRQAAADASRPTAGAMRGAPRPPFFCLAAKLCQSPLSEPNPSLDAALATTKPTAEPRSPPPNRGAAAIMTFPALLAHSSPPLRLWRFAGVVFLVAQAISDSLSLRDTWKAKHIVEQCLADGAPRTIEGVECNRCITKAWQKPAVGHPERLYDEKTPRIRAPDRLHRVVVLTVGYLRPFHKW